MQLSDLTPNNNITGGTDNTPIGNISDRLKVDAEVSGVVLPAAYSHYLVDDMNLNTGDLYRGDRVNSTFETAYLYNGSGLFESFLINLESGEKWYIRLLIDGVDVLIGSNGLYTKDLKENNTYDIKDLDPMLGCSIGYHDDATRFVPKSPIVFLSSVEIQIRCTNNKKFRAGFVNISKDVI